MKVGATSPPMRGQATDEDGQPVDLSVAEALTMLAVMTSHTITGAATAIQPPIADEDGIHHWNWQYDFIVGDTDKSGEYRLYLKVLWGPDDIEFFPDEGHDTLTIEAL
jgi:hypothetical protein